MSFCLKKSVTGNRREKRKSNITEATSSPGNCVGCGYESLDEPNSGEPNSGFCYALHCSTAHFQILKSYPAS